MSYCGVDPPFAHTRTRGEISSAENFVQIFSSFFRKFHPFRRSKTIKMRYVAAYLLAVLGAKENPTSGDIEKILGSVGIEADAEKLKKVISELSGKSIDELIKAGQSKLASMPSGGGAAAPAAAAPAEKKAEKKEEKKKEESEEEDDDMGFGLFD